MYMNNLITNVLTLENLSEQQKTRVTYTAVSGLPDWEGFILGEIAGKNIGSKPTTQIPDVQCAETIYLGDGVTDIGVCTFINCSSLTSVTIPNTVTKLGDNAFNGCSGLTNITIPSSVTTINVSAFKNCSELTSINIPNSVESIGGSVFDGCNKLPYDTTTIPKLKLLDGWVVGYTQKPTGNLDLTGVRGIAVNVFYTCTGITSATIPEGVKEIGGFQSCSGLRTVTMPSNALSIGFRAFYGCNNLESITIPSGVTSIQDSAFGFCSGLTSMTIPDSVTSIGDYAFYGCSGLTSVTIPDSVTSIGDNAFLRCSGLTSVTIGNGVTQISRYVFSACSNCTIFDFRKSTSVPTLDNVTAFQSTPSSKEIIVPDSLYDSWIAASNWSSSTYNIVNCIVKASQSSLGSL